MQTIGVLIRINRIEGVCFIESCRQRQLQQNSINRIIFIALCDYFFNIFLGCVLRQMEEPALHADGGYCFFLSADIGKRGRIVSHQYDR